MRDGGAVLQGVRQAAKKPFGDARRVSTQPGAAVDARTVSQCEAHLLDLVKIVLWPSALP